MSQNPHTGLKNSFTNNNGDTVVRITAKDLGHLEISNSNSEIPSPKNFRQKSQPKDPFDGNLDEEMDNDELLALFKEDATPALFRGTSGMIDPQTLKRK